MSDTNDSFAPTGSTPGDAIADPDGTNTVRFVTFNVLHGCRPNAKVDLDLFQSELSGLQADVIALQEMDVDQRRSFHANMPALAAEAVGSMATFAKAMTFDDGDYGNALLAPALSEVEHLLLPKRLEETEQRSAVIATVAAGGTSWSVAATHLSLDTMESGEQLAYLMEYMDEMPLPRVLLGDFNRLPPDVLEMAYARGWTAAVTGPTVPSWDPEICIDYVLVQGAAIVSARVMTCRISDHCAVAAELRVVQGDANKPSTAIEGLFA